MNSEGREYDRRQMRRMLDVIERYEHGQTGFVDLVDDLEALILALEHQSDEWRENALSQWGDLEQIRAVNLDRGTDINERQARDIHDALQELKASVQEAMQADA